MKKTPHVCLCALLVLAMPAARGQTLSLWAVDESGPVVNGTRQSPQLVVFTDYTSTSSSAINYGRLVWDDNGVIREFAGGSSTNAEAMALDSRTGQAWIIVNQVSGGFDEATLFTVDLSTLGPSTQVVLARIGPISGYTKVEALAYDEISGQLYAVAADQSGGNAEDFISISKTTAAPVFIGDLTGVIAGVSESVDQTDGLEIVHTYNAAGLPISRVFYAFDQVDRELYTVNAATGALMAVINNAPGSGTDIEALAWDYTSSRLLAMNNGNNNITQLSLVGNTAAVITTYNDQDVYGGADFEGAAIYSRPLSGLSIGNLIFADDNRNGVFDAGAESGIAGVEVQLWRSDPGGEMQVFAGPDGDPYQAADNASPLLTSANGSYHFKNLLPGTYRIKIAGASFDPGQPLDGWQSSPLAAAGDDNAGQDGVLNANDGAMSGLITLAVDSEPTNGGGGALAESGAFNTFDDSDDDNGDMTVDFGFYLQADDHGDFSGFADAGSIASSALKLGAATTDIELAAITNAAATGDDLSGTDDEDGVSFGAVVQGRNASVTVTATNSTASSAFLNAWIDFNANGSLADPGEQIIADASVASGASGGQVFQFSVPAGSATGGLGARFRLTSTGNPGPVGHAGSGEVEDVLVTVEPANIIGIGNLVFLDGNGNGHADAGEGVDGVTVQLYTSAQAPGTDTPLNSVVTSSGGKYLLPEVPPGSYRLHIPAAMFASGAPLHSTISIPEGLSGDDDVGEDGVNSADPAATGISSGIVSVAYGIAPTDLNGESGVDAASDNAYDASINLTIDFGFANPLGVGNLVFSDANLNGRYDSGEGVAGVTVELYRATDTPGLTAPLATQETNSAGHYVFDYLMAGSYFVHVPAAEFVTGGQLSGLVSVTGSGSGNVDDSADENGIDNLSPNVSGIRSNAFTLANNAAPTDATGESGYLTSEDSRDDDNYDLTIDLGFRTPDASSVGVGNSIFLDANGNHQYDSGEGINGVTVKLFVAGANPATATPVATTTSVDGTYLFAGLPAGSYFVQIPPSMFATGAPMSQMLSLPAQGGDNAIDDTQDENGDDPAAPAVSGVRSTTFTLTPDTEPTGTTSEFGSNAFIDDIDDNNTDLTIDFGFYHPVGLGNLVYVDVSRDGGFDPGEGINGVTVELYRDTQSPGFEPPLASTLTGGGGFYQFTGLVPGYYIVHIPTVNFGPGGVLAAYAPMSGQGADDGTDDELDENGSDPSQAFAEGVSSLTITLASGTEPTDQSTEHGSGGTSDNTADSDTDLTVDFGFQATPPGTFTQWQAQNPLGGQNGPTQDPDGDGLSNTAEYVFGLSPSTGVLPWNPFEIKLNTVTDQIDAYVRKLPAINDVTVTIQGLLDLPLSPQGWFDITAVSPEYVETLNGVDTYVWRNIDAHVSFAGGPGFVRLHLVLDADHDGTPEATFNSDVWRWSRHALQPQIISFSNPLSKAAVFTGPVAGVTGASLDVAAAVGSDAISGAMTGTIPWYIEVVSGDNEGHRFEVDEINSTATTIVLETSNTLNTLTTIPASLADDHIALRQHWTLAEWLPPSKFRATNSSGTADRLMFYTGATFASTWLYSNAGNPKWVNDATLADRGTRVMDACEALLIQPRSTSAPDFVNLGVVRAHKFASPLKQGTRLLAGGWPLDQSATSRGILYASGFTGASSATRAYRVQLWLGDTTPGASGYESHYLLKTTTLQQWVKSGDSSLTNENNLLLFKAFRGVYFNSYLGKPDYVAPLPWTP